jgi:hypothetical protein
MAPGIYGADIEQLRALSKSLGQSGTSLKTVETTVSSLVQSAVWKGEDGARFRNEWTSSLRPMLNRTSQSLQEQSRSLLVHADEQDKASNSNAGATSGPGASQPGPGQPAPGPASPGSNAPERQWTDAFTDPHYEHAPSGLEWLLEKWVDDGSGASDITSALQLVADKFSWNIDLADAAAGTSKFFDAMKTVGKGLVVVGALFGVLDIASGIENRDPFRVADGAVGGGLAIAAGIAAATGVGLPVAAAIGGAGLLWGLASMASGDVPVTKRIWDFGAGVVGGVKDLAGGVADGVKSLADGAQDAVGWVGGRLGFG